MMAQRIAVWHGTLADFKALIKAVERNCTCVPAEFTCPPHEMMGDQTTLDHLAFIAVRRSVYHRSEFDPTSEWF